MNSTVIDSVLRKNCAIYRGTFAADRLPLITWTSRPFVIVANTDPSSRSGQHWICIHVDEENHGEYFDSFGMHPKPVFERYMNRYCIAWTFSNMQMQSLISRFCGHYCIWYCMLKNRNVKLDMIKTAMTTDTGLNDFLIHRFACKLI